jgi:hypothetical protein
MYLVRWHSAFLYPQNRENLLGFSITPADGDWLRAILNSQEEVKALTRVETRLYDDFLDVTTGVIPGSEEPDKEIWFIQHLHEVGAHDNASGVACSLELARTILDLVRNGQLEPPKRTIRIICGWEIYGFMAHLLAHPELRGRVLCGVNPDMVGANQDLCQSWLQIYLEPHSSPSFIDDLTVDLTRTVYSYHPRWHWETKPFIINDNFLADPGIGIPCPSLIFLRDRYYHTSSDCPENLDPVVMEEISAIMAACAYTVTNGGSQAADELAGLIFRYWAGELAGAAAGTSDREPAKGRSRYILDVAGRHLDSLYPLAHGNEELEKVTVRIINLKARLSELALVLCPEEKNFRRQPTNAIEKEADSIIPERKVMGSLSLTRVPKEIRKERKLAEFSGWSYDYNAPVFWADGKRSIFEIQWLAGQELGKEPVLDDLIILFQTLQEYDYVNLKRR